MLMPYKQKYLNVSLEPTVHQRSEGFMCPSPSHGALLFERPVHPADKDVVRVCVFECHFEFLPLASLSTCLQQRCSSVSWCLQWHFAQVSQHFSHILVKRALKLLPHLPENLPKSYALSCKCKYVHLFNLLKGFYLFSHPFLVSREQWDNMTMSIVKGLYSRLMSLWGFCFHCIYKQNNLKELDAIRYYT